MEDSFAVIIRANLINQVGMCILGLWAVVNVVVGIAARGLYQGWVKFFFQMSLWWNLINLTVAIISLVTLRSGDLFLLKNGLGLTDYSNERLYLVYAGLDIVYFTVGLVLVTWGEKKEKSRDLFRGYGFSVMLQAVFLLIFDLTMYVLQYNLRLEYVSTF